MEVLKKLFIGLLVLISVTLVAVPPVLSADEPSKFLIDKLPGRPKAPEVTLTRGLTSVSELSPEISRNLDVLVAPNIDPDQSAIVGTYWECNDDDTRCDIILVFCLDEGPCYRVP